VAFAALMALIHAVTSHRFTVGPKHSSCAMRMSIFTWSKMRGRRYKPCVASPLIARAHHPAGCDGHRARAQRVVQARPALRHETLP